MKVLITTVIIMLFSIPSFAQDSLNVHLLFNWHDESLPASEFHQNIYNEVWGFARNDREYAVIASTEGTHIIDVSDPANSREVEFIPGAIQGETVVHRDYHDYKGYLYMVCDEGNSTLQIADLRYLPDSAPVVFDSDSLFSRAHNIFIDTTNAKLYACSTLDTNKVHNYLKIFSLADPKAPAFITSYNEEDDFHDIYVRNDTGFANTSFSGMHVYDFSDAANPKVIGSLNTYIQQGYNHSGWLHEDGAVYAMIDETHGRDIKILDVTNLSDITVIDTIDSGVSEQSSIAHNAIFKDDFLYVSYYHDGFYIYDVSDPDSITIAGFYDTYTPNHHNGYKGAWGVYPLLPSGIVLVSDMQTGLYVFDVSNANGSLEETCASSRYKDFTIAGEVENSHCKKYECSGKITTSATGGIPPYSYNWSSNSERDSVIDELCPGNYTVTVTDRIGCSKAASFDVFSEISATIVNNAVPASTNLPLTVSFECPLTKPLNYSMVNTNGQIIASGTLETSNNTIKIYKNLPSGLYLLKISDQEGKHLLTQQLINIKT